MKLYFLSASLGFGLGAILVFAGFCWLGYSFLKQTLWR